MVLKTYNCNINSQIHINLTISANKLSRITDKKTRKKVIHDIQWEDLVNYPQINADKVANDNLTQILSKRIYTDKANKYKKLKDKNI